MIKVENFPNAYKEIYEILKYMSKEDVDCIGEDFLNMIKEKMNKEYEFEYNPNLEFEEHNLLRETKAILAYIFLNYWANDEEQKIIKEKYKQDIIEDEKRKKEKYPNTDLFKDRRKNNINIQQNALIEYKQDKNEGFLKNVIRKILNFFKRKQ